MRGGPPSRASSAPGPCARGAGAQTMAVAAGAGHLCSPVPAMVQPRSSLSCGCVRDAAGVPMKQSSRLAVLCVHRLALTMAPCCSPGMTMPLGPAAAAAAAASGVSGTWCMCGMAWCTGSCKERGTGGSRRASPRGVSVAGAVRPAPPHLSVAGGGNHRSHATRTSHWRLRCSSRPRLLREHGSSLPSPHHRNAHVAQLLLCLSGAAQ